MADVRETIEFFAGVGFCALYVYKAQIAVGALAVIAVCLMH